MPSCPVCSTPVTRMEILCQRCFYEDDKPLLPPCQICRWNQSCPESWYQVCHWCMNIEMNRQWDNVVPIQSAIRGFLARKLLKKHKAARRLQTVWREHLRHRAPKIINLNDGPN